MKRCYFDLLSTLFLSFSTLVSNKTLQKAQTQIMIFHNQDQIAHLTIKYHLTKKIKF